MRLVTEMTWRSLEDGGAESAQLWQRGQGYVLHGFALRLEPQVRFDYSVVIDRDWLTREAVVVHRGEGTSQEIALRRKDDGSWRVNGQEVLSLHGCTDVDFGFSPATNLMPIRRLMSGLEEVPVRAALMKYPLLDIVPAEQCYRMLANGSVHYKSKGFEAELLVSEHGFVTHYPKLWSALANVC